MISVVAREHSLAQSSMRRKEIEMSLKKNIAWTGVALVLLLLFLAISMPNLMRSRIAANRASSYGRFQQSKLNIDQQQEEKDQNATLALSKPPTSKTPTFDKKFIRNAELHLIVVDLRDTADKIGRLAEAADGEIKRSEIADSNGYSDATVVIRVPAEGLNSALSAIKGLGLRTVKEEETTRDVTQEFYDNEAHLRNLRSEEQQYLAILKSAHTVKDILEASEHLSDVRDRIERLQTQIQVMSRDIAMSEIAVSLMQQSDVTLLGIEWRPLYNAKVAAHELLAGLGEWLDWLVAIIIKFPLLLMWTITIGSILLVIWRIGRWIWRKVFRTESTLQ